MTTTPLAHDYASIAVELRRIEAEKAKNLATPAPAEDPEKPEPYSWATGFFGITSDYDPA